ncbi:flagellar hook assembly protein FlgD [Azohydromonas lata]|uniref:Basal-body rod modification protein FlgD n=1 Tax=Azohydromonas lata TaxID=45677 RepID=A0ABU5IDT2_9BURK|nr:flagellar hook capping FlgD N-terminal domain-containing protein [Azohydromonas lata]MDZ5457262.1 flagellar hook capping FlgD N-terminal domain-containing protein [Azohydromonas lata]
MTTTATTSANSANPFAALSNSSTSSTSSSGSSDKNKQVATEDRFLTLLVAQMKNQDPLNPMDNAQVTSQLAQINTVSGLDKLNTTVAGLGSQFMQMQAVQAASLVNRNVVIEGNRLTEGSASNKLAGSLDLANSADRVQVQILDGAGAVIDTVQLNAQKAGRVNFEWTQPSGVAAGQTFKVTASAGSNAVTATPLTTDTVTAVSTSGQSLQLRLSHSGLVNYSAVKAFN